MKSQTRLWNLSALVFGLLSISAWASSDAATTSPIATSQSKTPETTTAKWFDGFSGNVALSHSNGFTNTSDPESELGFGLSYKLSERQSISVNQSIIKYYVIGPGDSEFEQQDTSLRFTQKFAHPWQGISTSLRASATLPVSEYSQRNNIRSKPEIRANFTRHFLKEKLDVSLAPYFRYQFNEFKTTQGGAGAGGGKPLAQYVFGIAGSTTYTILPRWSVALSGFWHQVSFEDTGYENRQSNLGLSNPPRHQYNFSLGTSFEITPKWTVSLSTSQLSYAEQSGRLEVYAFDPYSTDWTLDTQLRF